MAVSEGGAKRLQSSDVSGELEDPENPENSEDLGGLGDVLEGVLGGEQVEQDWDEEGEDPHQVDHVQEGDQEFKLEQEDDVWQDNVGKKKKDKFLYTHFKFTELEFGRTKSIYMLRITKFL